MTNVKVHLKEITKYVLLLGLGIQIALGVICCLRWLGSLDVAGVCGSLGGVFICALLGYLFLKSRYSGWSKKRLLLGTVGIVTSPMVLQAGLDIERESLPTYILAAVFVLFLLLFRKKRKKWQAVLGVVVSVFAVILFCNIGQNGSFAVRLAGRCCFPHLLSDVGKIPQELLDEAGYLELREALRSSDGIETMLYPQLMDRYGSVAEADRVCYHLARYGLANYTKRVAGNVIWDYVGYHIPPIVAELQLQGYGGDAITGYRYGQLTDRTGYVGTVYWMYSVVWYVLASALMVISTVPGGVRLTNRDVLLLFLLEVGIICLVMQGTGLFDYTKLLIVPFLWTGMVLKMAGLGKDCGDK